MSPFEIWACATAVGMVLSALMTYFATMVVVKCHSTTGGSPERPSQLRGEVRDTPVATVPCACGESKRYFPPDSGMPLGVHLTSICGAEPHFHRTINEVYIVTEGAGSIVLDGVPRPVEADDVIMIPAGVVHHGDGDYTVWVIYDHPDLHQTDMVLVEEG